MDYGLEKVLYEMIDNGRIDVVKQLEKRNLEGAFIDVGYIKACNFILEYLEKQDTIARNTDDDEMFNKDYIRKLKENENE